MKSFSSQKLETFARRLGFTSEALSHCLSAPTAEEGQRRLESLRERLKKSYRDVCLQCHPDHHPNREDKAEEFKQFNLAYNEIKDLLTDVVVQERPELEGFRSFGMKIAIVREEPEPTPFSANWWER